MRRRGLGRGGLGLGGLDDGGLGGGVRVRRLGLGAADSTVAGWTVVFR
ncbi:hypothetical protein [Saccharothrix sp. HUAS TT1]